MDNTIPSACVNSGKTSNDSKYGNGLKPTGRPSTKIFKDTTGHMTKATNTATMDHKLREPACTFNMEPVIVINLLASTSKFCDVKYITLFDKEEVNVYDAGTTTVTMSNPLIIKGLVGRSQNPLEHPARQTSSRNYYWPDDQSGSPSLRIKLGSKKAVLTPPPTKDSKTSTR